MQCQGCWPFSPNTRGATPSRRWDREQFGNSHLPAPWESPVGEVNYPTEYTFPGPGSYN